MEEKVAKIVNNENCMDGTVVNTVVNLLERSDSNYMDKHFPSAAYKNDLISTQEMSHILNNAVMNTTLVEPCKQIVT